MIIKSNIEGGIKYRFKSLSIPQGFRLVIDTREQKPLFRKISSNLIDSKSELLIIKKALKHGDYSILGFENQVTIERKQMSDFLSYLGKERDKTVKKLEAMSRMFFKALIIETETIIYYTSCLSCKKKIRLYRMGTPYDILYQSQVTVNMVDSFLRSVRVKYGLSVYFSNRRIDLERFILTHLLYCYEKLREV